MKRRIDWGKTFFWTANGLFWLVALVVGAEEVYDDFQTPYAPFLFLSLYAPFAVGIYTNWLVLIPKLLARRRYGRYLLILIGSTIGLSLLSGLNPAFNSELIDSGSLEDRIWEGIGVSFGTLSLAHLISLPLFLSFSWFKQQTKIHELANANLQNEMAALKAQFNPHFIFNSLNNIYSLALDRSELAAEMIMRLSKLLRYTSYQGRRDWVDLDDEISFLEDYLELQKIRLRDHRNVRFRAAIDRSYPVDVPPLLLVLPLENAFKHGVGTMGAEAYVHIDLTQRGNRLHFRVENNYRPEALNAATGIGLDQLRRRLELCYGQDFVMEISDRQGQFTLALELPLRVAESNNVELAALPQHVYQIV